MEKGLLSIGSWLRDIFTDTWAVSSGFVASIIGYFSPIRDPINLLLIFFAVDAAVGYLKNKKLYNQEFSKRKIFETTVPRMIAVSTFMAMLFAWDTTYNQEIVQTYMVVGYFIGGVLLFNIGKNFYKLTKWKAFLAIASMVQKDVQDKTGQDVSEISGEKHQTIN